MTRDLEHLWPYTTDEVVQYELKRNVASAIALAIEFLP